MFAHAFAFFAAGLRWRQCLLPLALALALVCGLPGLWVPAARAQPAVPAGFEQVSPRIWAFVAQDERSANGALFIGEREALAVDPGLTPAIARRFLAGVRALTDRPLRSVVLTHGHPDHAVGVACIDDASFELVASPATRLALADHLAAYTRYLAQAAHDDAERAQLRACATRLPTPWAGERREIDLGGHRVVVMAPGPAHTDGDLVLWSPSERVLATGDLFLNRSSPDMKSGSVAGLLAGLNQLLELPVERVIPGHFEVGGRAELARFRDYVRAVHDSARQAVDSGTGADPQAALQAYRDFRQFPQYDATFAGNLRAAARQYRDEPARPGARGGYTLLRRLALGRNPHQIAFSPDGRWAYVAIAGDGRIARVDAATLTPAGAMPVAGTPLGLHALAGDELLVTRFGGATIEHRRWGVAQPLASMNLGAGPSLISAPLPDGSLLVAAERADRLLRVGREGAAPLRGRYATGKRPFPPAATSDGRLAFVPNHDSGTVTVVDLFNGKLRRTVAVGAKPSGGAVLPGDAEYAVALRGENRIAFINIASQRVVSSLGAGIGASPFSVVVSPDGRLAFVNNTASHDVSVIALPQKRVVARIPVGEIPIVMAVHPSGQTLWVACEGSHEVDVIRIPPPAAESDDEQGGEDAPAAAAGAAPAPVAEVALVGTLHGGHLKSRRWGLAQLRQTMENFRPEVVIAEIPPDRWPRIWDDYASRGVVEDSRIRAFPEYVEVLLPLKLKLGFEVEPAAAWTQEMSDLRDERIAAHARAAPRRHAAYQAAEKAAAARDRDHLTDSDDPRVIHSARYDELTQIALQPYDSFLNDWIGPGGWTNINLAHYRLVDAAIRRHPGKRILITFGASHKYWLAEQLRLRGDMHLIDITPFLPPP